MKNNFLQNFADENDVMFYHTPISLTNPFRATVAAFVEEGNKLNVGVSLCSPNDNFCRKTGRKIATHRVISSKTRQIVNLEGTDRGAIVQLMKSIGGNLIVNAYIGNMPVLDGNKLNKEKVDVAS